MKLYMLLLGCRPEGRFTEQHDLFFGIGNGLKDLVPHVHASWPEGKKNLHVDAWREVNVVDGYAISVQERGNESENEDSVSSSLKLFFINLGGYRKNEFEEYHYKMLIVATDAEAAVKEAKRSVFFKHTGFKGAAAHVDDKYGIDVDEVYEVKDILPPVFKNKYVLHIEPASILQEDEVHLGYLPLWKIS